MASYELKPDPSIEIAPVDDHGLNDDDQWDMMRMGKTQELKRTFQFASIFSFSMILQASWEAVLAMATIGLTNGGSAGLIWIYFICWVGFLLVVVSMAEMGSIAPTTGGQYHWVSEFAPRKYQKFLSYLIGWLCVLGWQTSCASCSYIVGTQIQGLIILNYPDYVYEAWHGTLLSIAVAAFAAVFNIVLASKLPIIEALILIIHIFAFFGVVVTLWVLAPRAKAKDVFTTFSDGGGWGSLGASALVGINAGIMPFGGADAAVHMSEEIQDAGKNIPRSMIMTTVVNGAMGWIMAITFAFCMGNLDEIVASATGYPFMQVFLNATQSTGKATAMAAFIVAMGTFAAFTALATASRQLWAFSRDKALPFSPWFSYIHPRLEIPINSILVTVIITALLSLINIGSATALNSITSLSTTALLSSYICSIGCILWRRLTNQPIPPSKFSLGKWGLAINIASEVFLLIATVLAFFPMMRNPSVVDMNWNIVIYSFVVLGSLLYFIRARQHYVGPVEYVRKLD